MAWGVGETTDEQMLPAASSWSGEVSFEQHGSRPGVSEGDVTLNKRLSGFELSLQA